MDWEEAEHPLEDHTFRRLYVCLRPLIVGFRRGCRKLIALDGCQKQLEGDKQMKLGKERGTEEVDRF